MNLIGHFPITEPWIPYNYAQSTRISLEICFVLEIRTKTFRLLDALNNIHHTVRRAPNNPFSATVVRLGIVEKNSEFASEFHTDTSSPHTSRTQICEHTLTHISDSSLHKQPATAAGVRHEFAHASRKVREHVRPAAVAQYPAAARQ